MKQIFKKHSLALVLMLACMALTLTACGNNNGDADTPPQDQQQEANLEPEITLATTTSTEDSGLLDYLLPVFEQKYNVKVNVVSVGTGQAIETAQNGDADVILVHARAKEDQFVEEGYGIDRQDVMYNQFLIVGPEADPAGVKDAADINAAMKAIADNKAEFVSRGDESGTHVKEKALWDKAGITDKGDWYIEAGLGMGDTLQMASEKGAYTLTDEATYLSMKDKLNLVVVREGDDILLNPYGVILVNPEKHPNTRINTARAFANFLTSDEGQELIGKFGVEEYGKALFTPSANK